jgi:uncharacterized protein with PIN domain
MVESSEYIGKCPVCREELRKRDIEEVIFGIIIGLPPLTKKAYRCTKCETILGFSSQ